MPIRGENVGTAYVRILADGRELSKSIRDELEDTDDIFEEKGEDDTKAYAKGRNKQMKRERPQAQDDIELLFRLESDRIQRLTNEMGTEFFKGLERSIIKQNGRALGEHIINDMRKGFVSGGGYKQWGVDLKGLFDRMPQYVASANAKIEREQATLQKSEASRIREREKLFADSTERATEAYHRLSKGIKNDGEKIGQSIDRTVDHIKELKGQLEHIDSFGDKERKEINKTLRDMEQGLDRMTPRFRQFNGSLDRTVPLIARAFGKGSRNDFLNITGSMVGTLSRLTFLIPKLGESFFGLAKGIKAGQTPLAAIRGAFGGGAAAGKAFLSSMAAVSVAIPIVVAVVGTLISVVSLLAGTLTALASTISFALVGGLAAVAGTLAPIAAGVGVLAAAIAGMSDSQKRAVKEGIKPMVAGFKELGTAAANSIFGGKGNKQLEATARQFEETIKNMSKALTSSNMKQLVEGIGAAIGNVGNQWAASLNSPGFKKWLTAMSKTLPDQLEALGRIGTNTFAGIGGTLLAAQPIISAFLGWLERITQQWRTFTGSSEGQAKMLKFFADAKESARSLGDFLRETGGLLKDLLFNATGKDVGDSLFESMADAIARFRKSIANGDLERWFKDSKKFAQNLGDALVGLGKLLDSLDSAANRAFASDAFKVAAVTFEVLGESISVVTSILKLLIFPLTSVIDIFKYGWKGAVASVLDATANLLEALGGLGGLLGKVIPGLGGLADKAKNAGKDLHQMADEMRGVNEQEVKPKVDDKEIRDATDKGNDLFDLLTKGIPGAKEALAKVNKKQIDEAKEGLQQLLDFIKAPFPEIKPKVDNKPTKAATLEMLKLKREVMETAGLSTKGITIKINKAQAEAAKEASKDLLKVLRDIFSLKSKTINIVTNYKTKGSSPGGTGPTPTASGGIFGMAKAMASGGFANFAQNRLIGESGREAVVPLDRPLGQVDPAVRALSAFAQGKFGNTSNSTSKTIDASGWIIQTPTTDPTAVANEAINALIAKIV